MQQVAWALGNAGCRGWGLGGFGVGFCGELEFLDELFSGLGLVGLLDGGDVVVDGAFDYLELGGDLLVGQALSEEGLDLGLAGPGAGVFAVGAGVAGLAVDPCGDVDLVAVE